MNEGGSFIILYLSVLCCICSVKVFNLIMLISQQLYYITATLLLGAAVFILLSPSLVIPDLIYPQRIDSVYLQFQKNQFLKDHAGDRAAADSLFIFNPSDVGLQYKSFSIITLDSFVLKGWFIPS